MSKANPYFDPAKKHHTPTGFRNLEHDQIHSSEDVKRWRKERKENGLPKPPALGYQGVIDQWWQQADFSFCDDAVWWLGHATMLYQFGSVRILTDPVFSKRASPVSFYGPARRTPASVSVEHLPPIDVVVISHNHYDHLDLPSIRRLVKHSPQARFLVPLGLKRLVEKQGARQVDELDWWDDQTISGITFTCVPAHHWSVRSLWDQNQTLWCGWMMRVNHKNYYFPGDSAYSYTLKEIAERLGSVEVAALPIGAYAPRWMMKNSHMDPQGAARLHNDLGCQRSFAMHWGAFELSDEALDEPLTELSGALLEQNISPDDFQVIKIGAYLPL